MNINVFATMIMSGLAMGMIYALIAMGVVMLVRAIGVLNFAQGDLLMLGAYITSSLLIDVKLPLGIMIPIALISFALTAVIFMYCVYWPLKDAKYPAAMTIATVATGIVIKEIVQLIWGSLPRSIPSILINNETGSAKLLSIGSVKISWQYILITMVGAIAIMLVFILLEKLYAGRMMEAASQDRYTADLIGISTVRTITATYIISITLACIGGFMVAPIYTVNVTLGNLQLRAFAGVVIGGMGSIKGAIIGALLVGVLESVASLRFSAYKDAVVFMVLLIFLIVRPQGLFSNKQRDKA